jgi:hypothetical protein
VNVREFSVELLVLQGLTSEEVETDRWFCEGRSKPGLDSFDQKRIDQNFPSCQPAATAYSPLVTLRIRRQFQVRSGAIAANRMARCAESL